MQVTINARLTTKEMFNFLMHHNYRSFGGVTGVLISLGALALFLINITNEEMRIGYKVALLVIGLVYTVIQPIMLYKKAAVQVKTSDSINKPLTYTFDEDGITISLEDEKVSHKYEDVLMIKSTKVSVLVYVTRYRAFILPKRDIGEQFEGLRTILKNNVHNARCVDVR
jgi:hypothetical protein